MRKIILSFFVLLSLTSLALPPVPNTAAKTAFDKAEKALEAAKLDEAVAAYTEALAATPNYPAALNGLGSALFKQKKSTDAISNFKAAAEIDPTFKLAWFNLGYAARKTADFGQAAVAYEKYTQLDTNDPDGFYGLAESYKALGQNEKAIASYEKYLTKEKRPTEQKWKDKANESIAALKSTPVAVVAEVKTPTPLPSPLTPPTNTTTVPPTETATTPAPKPVESAATLSTLASAKLAEGDSAIAEKKYREASFAYQDAVNADPNNVEALFKLGNSFATLGYYDQAITNWQRVQQIAPDAKVKQSAQDNIDKAKQKMATAGATPQEAGKVPGAGPVADTNRQQARQHYELAVQYIGQRKYTEALAKLNECLKLEPALTVGYIARGSTLIGLRRFAEAAVDYQYALRIDPSVSSPLYGLAEAYRGLNRIDDARSYYQRYAASTSADVRPELQTDARNKLNSIR